MHLHANDYLLICYLSFAENLNLTFGSWIEMELKDLNMVRSTYRRADLTVYFSFSFSFSSSFLPS